MKSYQNGQRREKRTHPLSITGIALGRLPTLPAEAAPPTGISWVGGHRTMMALYDVLFTKHYKWQSLLSLNMG